MACYSRSRDGHAPAPPPPVARSMQRKRSMKRLVIRRRPDGVIELRRRRLRDSRVVQDVGRLLALLLFCTFCIAAMAALLVTAPLVVVVAAAFLLPSVLVALYSRSNRLQPAPARPPPRSVA